MVEEEEEETGRGGRRSRGGKKKDAGQDVDTDWNELLGDKWDALQTKEAGKMGKGKRERRQLRVLNIGHPMGQTQAAMGIGYAQHGFKARSYGGFDGDDDSEDENYKAPNEAEEKKAKKPLVKAPMQPAKNYLRVLEPVVGGSKGEVLVHGFVVKERKAFNRLIFRYGVADGDWRKFSQLVEKLKPNDLRHKTCEEITAYGQTMMRHCTEPESKTDLFKDGVPKEGLACRDLLIRLGMLHLYRVKLKKYGVRHEGSVLTLEAYRADQVRIAKAQGEAELLEVQQQTRQNEQQVQREQQLKVQQAQATAAAAKTAALAVAEAGGDDEAVDKAQVEAEVAQSAADEVAQVVAEKPPAPH